MLRRVPVKKLSTQMTSGAFAQQPLAQVRAEKAGAAGDQRPPFQVHMVVPLARPGQTAIPRSSHGISEAHL